MSLLYPADGQTTVDTNLVTSYLYLPSSSQLAAAKNEGRFVTSIAPHEYPQIHTCLTDSAVVPGYSIRPMKLVFPVVWSAEEILQSPLLSTILWVVVTNPATGACNLRDTFTYLENTMLSSEQITEGPVVQSYTLSNGILIASGTSIPSATIRLLHDGEVFGTGEADANGLWSAQTRRLPCGEYDFKADQTLECVTSVASSVSRIKVTTPFVRQVQFSRTTFLTIHNEGFYDGCQVVVYVDGTVVFYADGDPTSFSCSIQDKSYQSRNVEVRILQGATVLEKYRFYNSFLDRTVAQNGNAWMIEVPEESDSTKRAQFSFSFGDTTTVLGRNGTPDEQIDLVCDGQLTDSTVAALSGFFELQGNTAAQSTHEIRTKTFTWSSRFVDTFTVNGLKSSTFRNANPFTLKIFQDFDVHSLRVKWLANNTKAIIDGRETAGNRISLFADTFLIERVTVSESGTYQLILDRSTSTWTDTNHFYLLVETPFGPDSWDETAYVTLFLNDMPLYVCESHPNPVVVDMVHDNATVAVRGRCSPDSVIKCYLYGTLVATVTDTSQGRFDFSLTTTGLSSPDGFQRAYIVQEDSKFGKSMPVMLPTFSVNSLTGLQKGPLILKTNFGQVDLTTYDSGSGQQYPFDVSGRCYPGSTVKLEYWTGYDNSSPPAKQYVTIDSTVADGDGWWSLHSDDYIKTNWVVTYQTSPSASRQEMPILGFAPTGYFPSYYDEISGFVPSTYDPESDLPSTAPHIGNHFCIWSDSHTVPVGYNFRVVDNSGRVCVSVPLGVTEVWPYHVSNVPLLEHIRFPSLMSPRYCVQNFDSTHIAFYEHTQYLDLLPLSSSYVASESATAYYPQCSFIKDGTPYQFRLSPHAHVMVAAMENLSGPSPFPFYDAAIGVTTVNTVASPIYESVSNLDLTTKKRVRVMEDIELVMPPQDPNLPFTDVIYSFINDDGTMTMYLGRPNNSFPLTPVPVPPPYGAFYPPQRDIQMFSSRYLTLSQFASPMRLKIVGSREGPFSTQMQSINYNVSQHKIGLHNIRSTFASKNWDSVDQAVNQTVLPRPYVITAPFKPIKLLETTKSHGLGPASRVQVISKNGVFDNNMVVSWAESDLYDSNGLYLTAQSPSLQSSPFTLNLKTNLSPQDNDTSLLRSRFIQATNYVADSVLVEFPSHGFNEIKFFYSQKADRGASNFAIVVTKFDHGWKANEEVTVSLAQSDASYVVLSGEVVDVISPTFAHLYFKDVRFPYNSQIPYDPIFHGFVGRPEVDFYGIRNGESSNVGVYSASDFVNTTSETRCRLLEVIDRNRFRISFPSRTSPPQINQIVAQGGQDVRISSSVHSFDYNHTNIDRIGGVQLPITFAGLQDPFFYLCVRVPGYLGSLDKGMINQPGLDNVIAKIIPTQTGEYLYNTFVANDHVFLPVVASNVSELHFYLRKADGTVFDMGTNEFTFTLQIEEIEDKLEAEGVVSTQTPQSNLMRT